MFDGIRRNPWLKEITQRWFWEYAFEVVSGVLWSRSTWVLLGNAGTFLSALAGAVYLWSRPFSWAAYGVVQLACLFSQAVAMIPVVWPGRTATARDVGEFADSHQGLTVATVCGSWIFGVCPGLFLLTFFGVDVDSPPWSAVFLSGTALMLACIAGLITATAIADKVKETRREAPGPEGVSGPGDSGDSAAVDSGGFDGD
ncbi:hypothetical protein H9Y04_20875 [Streptomyces sp. TRM66268-LWL]|uniref:Uncharacterized protein n=1 Tax=Streptomyces polyasparticus TaxID=2767826 RepID=A0ABR7SJ36_9ACTN|nr:hypothetical protein [Streptomyces polyasparticus]MBC9715007.1 hypothetical protein [Streptomyces polyasparticus]